MEVKGKFLTSSNAARYNYSCWLFLKGKVKPDNDGLGTGMETNERMNGT